MMQFDASEVKRVAAEIAKTIRDYFRATNETVKGPDLDPPRPPPAPEESGTWRDRPPLL